MSTFHAMAGNGTAVHLAFSAAATLGRDFTACGAEGRGMRIFRLRRTTNDITCSRCAKSTRTV